MKVAKKQIKDVLRGRYTRTKPEIIDAIKNMLDRYGKSSEYAVKCFLWAGGLDWEEAQESAKNLLGLSE